MQKTPTRLHDTSKIASKGNSYVILAISKMHEGLQLKFSKLRVQEKKYQDNDVDVVFENDFFEKISIQYRYSN